MVKLASIQALHTLPDYISRMDEGQLICRARHRHNFPSDSLRAGQGKPEQFTAVRQHDGSFQVQESCLDCGKECTWTTLPRGVIGTIERHYKDPERWVRIPREVEYSTADLKAAHMGMVYDALFGSAPRRRRSTK